MAEVETPPPTLALRALVFASGAAGLAYEISWSRQLGLTFGQTARAAAIVLGAYFLGMALGYALAGGASERMRRPLAGYAGAEVVAGVWAFLVPGLLAIAPGHVETVLGRTLLALVVLLPGTTALGASLPFVAQAAAGRGGGTERVARLYATNLAGAVAGVAVATWFLAPVGVVTTSWVAAGVSIGVGVAAWALRDHDAVAPAPRAETTAVRSDPTWTVAAAVSGLGALAAQVLYVRLFTLVFHNSTYTFATLLFVVLVALAAASMLASRILRRFEPRGSLVAASLVAAAGMPLSVLGFVQLQGFRYFGWGDTFGAYMLAATGLVAAVVFVPVLAMGMVLPLAWHLAGADRHPGSVVGRLTTANTLGAALGAIGTSFALVPLLDLWGSFAAICAVYLLLGAWVASSLPARWRAAVLVAAAIGLGSIGMASRVDDLKDDERLVQRFTGPYGWTDVVEDAEGYHRRLRQNIHYGLGSRSSTPMQLRQGSFPLLLHPDPQRVAFVGLATGVTASAALDRPEVERITVMELIPEVVEAARLFEHENHGLLDDPRVQVRVGDGRSVLGSASERYDVIVSDLFVPWESKTGYLYTVEHFEAVRQRLDEGGVFCQWLAGWQVGPDELETIAQSLRTAFPHVAIWQLSRSDDWPLFALVAVDAPRRIDRSALEQRLGHHRPPALGSEDVLRHADDVVAWYTGDWQLRPGTPLNTDEHPVVEFTAPMTHRQRGRRLRREGFRAYERERLRSLGREVFTFDPPALPTERALPR